MNEKTTIDLQNIPFWSMEISKVVGILETDAQKGLSENEAKKRIKIFGPNIIEKRQQSPVFFILLNQFRSPLILILLSAGIITFSIAHYRDAIFIFAALMANTILGFYQEYKAEKALAELKTYLKQRIRVIRESMEHEIDAANLVPGDIIHFSQGDRIPTDGRLFYVNELQIDETILTGESLPVSKTTEPVSLNSVIGDQNSMVFAGTVVTQGVGIAVTCRTDFSTELGKIATLVAKSQREETPLQNSIKRFSIKLGIFVGIFTVGIFITGIALGYSPIEMFLTAVAIAVSAVPEGLPVAMTVILSVGVQRMARRKGVIRKLIAAETLGSATVILTDKTGTLTEAKMELDKILPITTGEEKKLLEMALINTDVLIENPSDPYSAWRTSGRVLETSLVRSAALRGVFVEDIKNKTPVLSFLPFNAANKFSASLIHNEGKHLLIFFGAPDIFVNHSTMNETEKNKILEEISSLAESGKLVTGIATKEIEKKEDFAFSKDLNLKNLSFKGLITLRDPVRSNVKEAINSVEASGIKVVMMTGDHRGTAESVAKEVGMNLEKRSVLDSSELQTLSDTDLKERLSFLKIISRVSPTDKIRIVKAFQETGKIVAMAGDGVNDAPSIKQADIGIAMGSGTEVARDVADLVLLDDNFETIAAAVKEGRQIMSNIRKTLVYLLSDIADELLLIGGALITGLALPLNALQILYVNFFADSFPAVAFAFEKNIDGLNRRSQKIKTGLFDPVMKFLILFIGLSTSALLFFLYWLLLRIGFSEDLVRTFIFASFGSYTLFLAFSVRSLEKSIFRYSLFSNLYLFFGVCIGIILMGMAIYAPFMQSLLDTVSLPPFWILGVLFVGVFNIAAVEFGKWVFRIKKT
ncbi:MAG: hypothetical protein COV30_02425 [Candidatus Yanofskybacteria bacterium CG10_big_fil_rev_8_21_14_0_10_37_15]|uniref:Cation-transporting P-type ATPase N-terminal domain-containing protein n=1 Tax=Candidatus Yanofskybacteria bacterium CG10_big_fil_rev_8_21_14_0_10_37_15 TaxID=1975097 RepID=A0A2H0R6L4_9BACT|nr:MAG: hypothetical protein COV30_02425 [Candidatus Yanofskybacteria bacterium CG10_big_fil_rev_8_21_14_0_10_37_15]